ncbi:MAG: Flp pilus assembly complex ATPase component TadA [Candidatus Zixiibacteriota bacterium]|nr:MAG: Flp pilus assembly complex ATPase component TadA [candidate division Zixibacteria bacterium]
MAKKKIGDLLVEKGLISPQQLEEGLREQSVLGKRLGEILVDKGYITEEELIDAVSERLSIPKISLSSMVIDPAIVQRVSVEVARRYTLIPVFEIGNTLTIAMADPLNIIAIDEIKYLTGLNIKRAIATATEIKDAIDQYYSVGDSLSHIMGPKGEENAPVLDGITSLTDPQSETPIIKLVNLTIAKAVKEKASDIHIEPEESRLRIRYRVDSVMREEAAPPKSMQNELISRIKIAANLDVSEKRVPQDGRFFMKVDGQTVDLRVSTLPTIHGEKIVIRILDRRNLLLTFDQLGFSKRLEERWRNIIHKPEGLVLISGPTSSGKTSTLYAALQEINSIEKNIITVEDPVEYSLPLIIQIQINEKAGLTFPSTLRSILRQNPDVIMIGEIRDTETAQMAIRSSLTGHLVFSTIHTNDAPSAITRLIDMGIESYLVASAIKGVLAQRLVRVNCPECSESYDPPELVIQRAGLTDLAGCMDFKRGTGCPTCKMTGFRGQTGIFEFVEVTPSVAELVIKKASLSRIKEEAHKYGYIPLFEMGLEKLTAGQVCLEELLKETSNVDTYETGGEKVKVTAADAHTVQI